MYIARPVNTPFELAVEETAISKYEVKHDSNFDVFTLSSRLKSCQEEKRIEKEIDDFVAEIGFSLAEMRMSRKKKKEVIIDVPIIQKIDPKDEEPLTVLSSFGFSPIGVEEIKEQRELDDVYHHHRFDVFSTYKDWTYAKEVVIEVDIPPVGNELFTKKFENSTMVVTPSGIVGPTNGCNVIFGVRPKVTRVENVCFGITLFDGRKKKFFWSIGGIREVDSSMQLGVYDIDDRGQCHLLSGVSSSHPWYYFNQSWLKSKVALELDVNGCSYVSYVSPEIFLRFNRGSCCDLDKNEYEVLDLPDKLHEGSIIRVIFIGESVNRWVFCEKVNYRFRPDSVSRIKLMTGSVILVNDLVNHLIIPFNSQRILVKASVEIKAVTKLSLVERNRMINSFRVPLVRNKLHGTSRNALVWEYCHRLNFYSRGDIDDYLRYSKQIFIGNNSFGDVIRKRCELMILRMRTKSFLVCGFPRLDITWTLKLLKYDDFKGYFPELYLVNGKVAYYRLFLSVVDNNDLDKLNLLQD